MEGSPVAEVAVPVPIEKPLTYLVPPELDGRLKVGMRVVVEVKKKVVTGFVVGLGRVKVRPQGLKPVREVVDAEPVLTPELLKLAAWMADYYVSTPGEVLAAMSPPPARLRRLYRLERRPGELELEIMRAASPLKAAIVEALGGEAGEGHAPAAGTPRRGGKAPDGGRALAVSAIRRRVGAAWPGADVTRSLRELAAEGLVSTEVAAAKRRVRKAASGAPAGESSSDLKLTPAQDAAFRDIAAAIADGSFKVFLTLGVTGSGKTEVYLRSIAETVSRGKTAIYLVPEIGLTPQIMARVAGRFGEKCAVLHSRLSAGERSSTWQRIRSGAVDVVVGPRSAVFAPLAGLGLVVVDEEHEASYKQQDAPRYNAREVAIIRARDQGAVVILGSATPTIETYYNAANGRYALCELPERISGGALPEVSIVDMRSSGGSHFSAEARRQIALSLAAREQVVLFLNRRGYSNYVQCLDCGLVPRCRNCRVTLTYHRAKHELVCHYCGYSEKGWEACPNCKGVRVDYVGLGTQKIEDYISAEFPEASCARFDKDSTRRKGSTEALLADFAGGMVRMLVGTQMLAKGHDFRAVGLVVVVNADVTMNLPDFRSGERTFQIVTQVAGRAGRGEIPGKVIVQTWNPGHHALKYARQHDFKGFYAEEVALRRDLYYPPFARLARVVAEATKESLAKRAAKEFAELARRLGKEEHGKIEIMGPSRAPISKIKNVYRWHLLVKGDGRTALSSFLKKCLGEVEARQLASGARLSVDVDPQVMM